MLDTLAVINRRPDIGRKSPFLPHLGGPHHNIAIMHGMEKLQWCGYPMVVVWLPDGEKIRRYVYSF